MTEPDAGVGARWRMPAEWEPHDGCLMAWPTRRDLWQEQFDAAVVDYTNTAAAIATFEPVTMIAAPGQGGEARCALPGEVTVIELPIDDSWLRDSGPVFTVDSQGRRAGVDFVFNSWGEKFAPFDADAAVAAAVLDHLGETRRDSLMVLEGGSITVDGAGTLVTTEQCVLHPSRNPEMSRAQIEAEWHRTLGVDTVVWLPWGLVEDTHTDGHVDNVCAFVRPGQVITQSCDDPTNPNHGRMAANLEVLRHAVDATGSPLEVIELPQHSYFEVGGDTHRNSYLNFYVANGGVVVPTADHGNDADALAIVSAAFPDREVVGVSSRILAYGGGG
ncbi:MAG: agmatine deiminase family protein, partial [Ilumatobacter sp.]